MIIWGSPWGGSPPLLNRLAPPLGAPIGASDALVFSCLQRIDGTLPRIKVSIRSRGRTEIAFQAGRFFALYERGSSRTADTAFVTFDPLGDPPPPLEYQGWRFTLRRAGGWPGAFEVLVDADGAGLEPQLGGPSA